MYLAPAKRVLRHVGMGYQTNDASVAVRVPGPVVIESGERPLTRIIAD